MDYEKDERDFPNGKQKHQGVRSMKKLCGFTGKPCTQEKCHLWNVSLNACEIKGMAYNIYAILKHLKNQG